MKDLIIIGAGPAGIAAAIYAKRSGLDVLVIEKNLPGGLINNTNIVENYPGFKSINGATLAINMSEHLEYLDIEVAYKEVIDIEIKDNKKRVITNTDIYDTKYIIIATGRSAKKLDLSESSKYYGKGLSYCAICDGIFFKDKDVLVVGGGNSALEEANFLAKYCKSVKILVRKDKLRAEKQIEEQIRKLDNVEIMYNKEIETIFGKDKVEGVVLNDKQVLQVSGIFVYIGYEPKTDFVKNLNLTNDQGYIEVDENFETKISGIYACGDIIKKKYYQIITAVSEGATASLNIKNDLSKKC